MSDTIEYHPSNEEVMEGLIGRLLDKTEDREMDVELFGFPADCLDSPLPKNRVMEQEMPNADYMDIEIMRFANGDVVSSVLFDLSVPEVLLDFGMKKAWISSKRLRSLIHDCQDRGIIVQIPGGEKFVIRLDKRLLLDNCVS